MFGKTKAFSSFSVNNLEAAKAFYGDTLGITVEEDNMGLHLKVSGSPEVFVYQKDNHEPATFTVLNFPVEDLDQAMSDLQSKGIAFEHYEGMTDASGAAKGRSIDMGPDIAWFKDPAGNVLSIMH